MGYTLIKNATLVNEGRIFQGSVLIKDDTIDRVIEGKPDDLEAAATDCVDADGLYLLPGVIDTHVHFRDGGQSENPAGNFASESRAARAGGVTSVIDMPNTKPQTTGLAELEQKEALAARVSQVNYGFMLGATNDNIGTLLDIEPRRYAAIKLFLGSSTGNMLVNDASQLDRLFEGARKLIVAHCEDEAVVQANLRNFRLQFQGTPGETAALHPQIRNVEACFLATYHAIERARRYGTRLHIAHLTTATELDLLSNFPLADKKVTAEVTPNHLFFSADDYAELGNLIKCNPAIKGDEHRLALWAGLKDGLIDTIATDHAPHPLEAKRKPYFDAPSGIPSVQHSLQMMLETVFNPVARHEEGMLDEWLPLIVEKMCHAPAELFGIEGRGYIRPGYRADLVLVRPDVEQQVTRDSLLSLCGWSPLEGQTFHTRVERVWVNGQSDGGAAPLSFSR